MLDLIRLIFGLVVDLFRSRAALEAEVLVLRQQITVLRRGKPTRLTFIAADKLVLSWVCRLFPNAHDALAVVRPETVIRSGRPAVPAATEPTMRCPDDRNAAQCRFAMPIASDRAPTKTRVKAQVASRLNQLRDTNLRPR